MQSHQDVLDCTEEVLELKNWTGLSLRELAKAGRVTVHSNLEGWIKDFFLLNDWIYGGFYAERLVEQVKFEIEKLK